ncbi:hypothetical protein TeGR_g12024, partial [Tetraparma gracilis]
MRLLEAAPGGLGLEPYRDRLGEVLERLEEFGGGLDELLGGVGPGTDLEETKEKLAALRARLNDPPHNVTSPSVDVADRASELINFHLCLSEISSATVAKLEDPASTYVELENLGYKLSQALILPPSPSPPPPSLSPIRSIATAALPPAELLRWRLRARKLCVCASPGADERLLKLRPGLRECEAHVAQKPGGSGEKGGEEMSQLAGIIERTKAWMEKVGAAAADVSAVTQAELAAYESLRAETGRWPVKLENEQRKLDLRIGELKWQTGVQEVCEDESGAVDYSVLDHWLNELEELENLVEEISEDADTLGSDTPPVELSLTPATLALSQK